MSQVGVISSGVVLGVLLGASQASALYKSVPDVGLYLTGGDLVCEGRYCDRLNSKFVDTVNGFAGSAGASEDGTAGASGVTPTETASTRRPLRSFSGGGPVTSSSFVSLFEEDADDGSSTVGEVLTAVPVPASLPLLLGAFGLAALVTRRRS